MKILIFILLTCLMLSSLVGAFKFGVIPDTEPHFTKTYGLKKMKRHVDRIGVYSKSSKVKPIGYKFECEKITTQLKKIKKEKAAAKVVYGLGGKKTGDEIMKSYFGKAGNELHRCDMFM